MTDEEYMKLMRAAALMSRPLHPIYATDRQLLVGLLIALPFCLALFVSLIFLISAL